MKYADYSDGAALRELAPDIAEHDVYMCGPDESAATVSAAP